MAATVRTKRGSSGSMTPSSGSSSTLASRSSESKAAVKAPRFSFQARSSSVLRIGAPGLLVPGALGERFANGPGRLVPIVGAILQPQPIRDGGQPMTAGPAHRHRMRMDALAAAIFPDAGVGLQGGLGGLFAERLQQPEQTLVAGTRDAAAGDRRTSGSPPG